MSGTLVGNVFLAATGKGLCAVFIGDRPRSAFKDVLARMFPGESFSHDPRRLRRYRRELEEYFSGKRTRFTLPLDLSAVRSPFRRKVLGKLSSVPFGRVISYGALARRSGSPGAARAVGTAMATNPISLVIPCHRVVGSGGGLGGYSAGLPKKKKLLIHEGVEPTRPNLIKAGKRR
jgi:methylated-DNA-[protein]-cysteine S-methyltransferase